MAHSVYTVHCMALKWEAIKQVVVDGLTDTGGSCPVHSDLIKLSSVGTLWVGNHGETKHATVHFLHSFLLLPTTTSSRGSTV